VRTPSDAQRHQDIGDRTPQRSVCEWNTEHLDKKDAQSPNHADTMGPTASSPVINSRDDNQHVNNQSRNQPGRQSESHISSRRRNLEALREALGRGTCQRCVPSVR
jgi:hypothetical protein